MGVQKYINFLTNQKVQVEIIYAKSKLWNMNCIINMWKLHVNYTFDLSFVLIFKSGSKWKNR